MSDERTYLEHGNAPYLNRNFFSRMASDMPEDWLLFIAERVAYGRYWGALERVDCLHFEACYYQPLAWCITNAYQRFEGGAQGEHKLARALLPVTSTSAHWLAQAQFMTAVDRYLSAERDGIQSYVEDLTQHSPFKSEPCAASARPTPARPG